MIRFRRRAARSRAYGVGGTGHGVVIEVVRRLEGPALVARRGEGKASERLVAVGWFGGGELEMVWCGVGEAKAACSARQGGMVWCSAAARGFGGFGLWLCECEWPFYSVAGGGRRG